MITGLQWNLHRMTAITATVSGQSALPIDEQCSDCVGQGFRVGAVAKLPEQELLLCWKCEPDIEGTSRAHGGADHTR